MSEQGIVSSLEGIVSSLECSQYFIVVDTKPLTQDIMGRLSIIEKSIENVLLDVSSSSWHIGLLVGCVTEQKDFIVHYANTPIEDKDTAQKLIDLPDVLITSHAGELVRMLPGGVCICGVAVVGSDLSSCHTKLQQLMTLTYKKVSQSDVYGDQTDCWQLVLVDSLTKRISSRSLLVSDYKSTLSPSEVRFQSLNSGWVIAKSRLTVDQNFYVCREQENEHFEQQLLGGLSSYLENITNSLCLCNGRLVDEEEQFGLESGKGKKSSQQTTPTLVDVQLLSRPQGPSSSSCNEKFASMWLKGTVSTIAFLRAPATAQRVTQALKADMKKSLMIRCQLLCEDILQVGSEKHSLDISMIYETPPRVYISHDNVPTVVFNDYMFKDDRAEDCAERAQQILGIHCIDTSNIDTTSERAADMEDIDKLSKSLVDQSEDTETTQAAHSSYLQRVGGIVSIASGAMIALAVSISYLNMDEWFG